MFIGFRRLESYAPVEIIPALLTLIQIALNRELKIHPVIVNRGIRSSFHILRIQDKLVAAGNRLHGHAFLCKFLIVIAPGMHLPF